MSNNVKQFPGKEQKQTPLEFIRECVKQYYQEKGHPPAMIIMSTGILKLAMKEAKNNSNQIKGSMKYTSVMLMLEEPIQFAGVEVVICGGKDRFALI